MRYLLPWSEDENDCWVRLDITTGEYGYGEYIHQDRLDEYWYHDLGGCDRYYSLKNAQQAMDKYFIDNGDYLIEDDEVERFREKFVLLM